MDSHSLLLAAFAIVFYSIAIALPLLNFQRKRINVISNSVASRMPSWIALLLHGLLLSHLIITEQGLDFGFVSSLVLCAWLVTAIVLFMALSARLMLLSLIVFSASIICIVVAILLPSQAISSAPLSPVLTTHIALSIFAYSVLAIAATLALLLAIADHQLHTHQHGVLSRLLPPLQTLEHHLFRLLEAGFILLSLALLSGFLFTDDLFNHKIVFSCIAWLVFFTLILGRHKKGWRGRVAIRWTIGGFIALALAYFGTKVVLEFIVN